MLMAARARAGRGAGKVGRDSQRSSIYAPRQQKKRGELRRSNGMSVQESDDPLDDNEIKPVEMELLRVEFSQIKSLDQHEQTFGVRCFLQFIIRNGAKENHEDALPTSGFRSAEWLMTSMHRGV